MLLLLEFLDAHASVAGIFGVFFSSNYAGCL
jgi:hypothetical protein